jgi:hypothetical protein
MIYTHIDLSEKYPGCEFIRVSLTAIIVVDKEFAWLKRLSWCLNSGGYAITNRIDRHKPKGKKCIGQTLLHHYILPKKYNSQGLFVDHINGNIMDNRKCNLRYATPLQSAQNRGANSGRKYKGAVKNSKGKFISHITANYKGYHLGIYDTEQEAAQAYNEAASKYYGEYARLNEV